MMMLLLSLVNEAHAIQKTLCVQVEPEFAENESSVSPRLEDHYLDDNDYDERLRGVYLRILKSGSVEAFGYTGSDGCLTIDVSTGSKIVEVRGSLRYPPAPAPATPSSPLGATKVAIYPSSKSSPVESYNYAWSVTSGGPLVQRITIDVDSNLVDYGWAQTLLVVQRAFVQLSTPPDNVNYRIRRGLSPSGHPSSTLLSSNGATIYLDKATSQVNSSKYVAAHELGHAIAFHHICEEFGPSGLCDASLIYSYYDGADQNDAGVPSICKHPVNSWDPWTREHATLSADEGWAEFLAAHTFTLSDLPPWVPPNTSDGQVIPTSLGECWLGAGTGCSTGAYSVQGNGEVSANGEEYNIGGIVGRDFFTQKCKTGTDGDRATPLDWTRFWWDAVHTHTSPDVTADQALEVFGKIVQGSSAPHQPWCTNPSPSSCATGTRVKDRASAAFSSSGLSGVWTSQKDNGVDR